MLETASSKMCIRDSYAFCQVFSVLPSLLVLLAGLTVKVGRMLRVKNRFWYFLIGFSWCATFPFVRMSAVLGSRKNRKPAPVLWAKAA